jgi:diguanylate cyclase (GGDEF)-like protein/PAS domain S-box-containing protein
VAAESANAAGALVMAGATLYEFRLKPRRLVLAMVWLGLTVWVAVAQATIGPFAHRLPVSLLVCGVLLASAAAFWRRADRTPGVGYRWVAVLFALLGLHKLDYPWLVEIGWLVPAGFIVTEVLSTALALALILSADRVRGLAFADERRRNQRLLELQGAAIAAAANAMLLTDRSGRIEWVNDAFSRLSGYSAEEVIGRRARRLLWSGDGSPEAVRRMMEALKAARAWRGELELRRKDGTLYAVDQTVTPLAGENGRIAHYVVVQEDITERRRAEERVRYLSHYDSLTALPNRLLFREHLQKATVRARAERSGLAVLLLDLDDLSRVNDTLGHEVADRFLVLLVERLTATARGTEAMGRVGGDEFAFLLADGATAEAAAELAQALIDAVCRPIELDGQAIHMGASVGIALCPADGDDAEVLIKNAEIAMYRAMREAPNGYRFFASRMDVELAERRRLESDLRRALVREELVLHYQPQVDIGSGRIIGFEALLRWYHPEDGSIAPARFIPLAEDCGLIAAIGEWVLRQACRQARAWNDAGLPAVPMAVNLSANQLRRQDLVLLVCQALQDARLPAGQLELELTESAVMHDAEVAGRVLDEIKALGVRLAIDDFGTGYSSLARLKRFPVDKLKIDQSFVADLADDPNDAAIARAIIHLGHSLGLKVVSEGVETEAQLAYLREQGCDAVQGWFYSPAVPADEAARLLRRGGF